MTFFSNIDTDLRATPAALATHGFLGLGFLGIVFVITSLRFSWPVSPDGAIGLGGIFCSIGFGIGFAFFKRRREIFQSKGQYKK